VGAAKIVCNCFLHRLLHKYFVLTTDACRCHYSK
jgi:hypothetical protein